MELGNKKNADAQYLVSRACEHGLGVESDAKKMWDWLVKASDNGSGKAMHRIFYYYRFSGLCSEHGNREKAAIWLEKAFDAGAPSAILAKAVFAENTKSMGKEDDNGSVRQAAVQELARGWKNEPWMFGFLANCAVNDTFKREGSWEMYPRLSSLENIGKLFPDHPRTFELLKDRAKNDSDEKVRKFAEKALEKRS